MRLKRPELKLDFAHDYALELLGSASQIPASGPLHHFPVELDEHDREGVLVRVIPRDASSWCGFFALGYDSPHAVTAAASCPHPQWLCVVSGGYGYLVNSCRPLEWVQALDQQKPVLDVRAAKAAGLLLLASFTVIAAYSATGLAWQTEQLSWDGLRITDIGARELRGFGWDAIKDKEVEFVVDLATGRHTGGAKPGMNS